MNTHSMSLVIGLSSEPDTEVLPKPFSAPALLPGVDVYCDLVYLYRNILVDYPGSDWVNKATRAVLNSKYFVKELPFVDDNDPFLTFTCRLMPILGDNHLGKLLWLFHCMQQLES
jgi:hypothetical protein